MGVLFGLTIPEHAAVVEEEKAVEMTKSASGDVENGEGTSAQSSPVEEETIEKE